MPPVHRGRGHPWSGLQVRTLSRSDSRHRRPGRGSGLLRLAGMARRQPARSTDGRWPCRRPCAPTSSSPVRVTCPCSRRGVPMLSFRIGSLFGRGRTRALVDSALPHAPIEGYREGRTAARNRRTQAPSSADRSDRRSRPGRVRFAVAATPHRRHPVIATRHAAAGGPQGRASRGRSLCTASLSSPTLTLPRRA